MHSKVTFTREPILHPTSTESVAYSNVDQIYKWQLKQHRSKQTMPSRIWYSGSIHSKFYKSICRAYWVVAWYKYLFETSQHSLLKIPPTTCPPLKSFLNSPEQMVTRAGPPRERSYFCHQFAAVRRDSVPKVWYMYQILNQFRKSSAIPQDNFCLHQLSLVNVLCRDNISTGKSCSSSYEEENGEKEVQQRLQEDVASSCGHCTAWPSSALGSVCWNMSCLLRRPLSCDCHFC